MDDRQPNFGSSLLRRVSRNQTPANEISGREAGLFISPEPGLKQEGSGTGGAISSMRVSKRPAERGVEASTSKRQRPGVEAGAGGRIPGQTQRVTPEIIAIEDDDVAVTRVGDTTSPAPGPTRQPGQENRSVPTQQRAPASSVDLTSDEDVVSFQILDEAVRTMTLSAAFQYIKRRMEKVYRRRAEEVLMKKLEEDLEVIATAISSSKSTRAFIMTTYQNTWKKKLLGAVRCSEAQYDKVLKLRDEHDWQDDRDEYDKAFVKPKLRLYEAAKKDFQTVEKLIDVLKGI